MRPLQCAAMASLAVGMSLGDRHARVAVWEEGRAAVLVSEDALRATPCPAFPGAPPAELAAHLQRLGAMAATYAGGPVQDVVLAVPGRCTEHQRRAALDACRLAELRARLISEPTAAALACFDGDGESLVVFREEIRTSTKK